MMIKIRNLRIAVIVTAILATIVGTANLRVASAPDPPQFSGLTSYGVQRFFRSATVGGHSDFHVHVSSTVGPIFVEQIQLSYSATTPSNVYVLQVTSAGMYALCTASTTPTCQTVIPFPACPSVPCLVPAGTAVYGEVVKVIDSLQPSYLVTDPMGNLAIPGAAVNGGGALIDVEIVTRLPYFPGTTVSVAITATAPTSATAALAITNIAG